ncbi:PilW family protein [Sporosarcina sp. BP05]|uniref:PilW family protein n=1 Tax=Sporosarcina sp. BP05 TaxID=2758726 RepID=UPI001645FAF6|nr:hypothetical protein [Sporosarcina sp. BP05]
MLKNEDGMTLVEVLATLLLMTLITGIIWTTLSIATKFNVSETSALRLQQEANYIIAELQQVHRHCYSYRLTIIRDEVKVAECKNDTETSIPKYDGVISGKYKYRFEDSGESPYINKLYISPKDNLELFDFVVIDPVKRNKEEKAVKVPTTISRYLTDVMQSNKAQEGS